jgi:hypothetical protein
MRKPNKTSMLLFSGDYFDFADPRPENIHLEDIAHGLSNINRFSGQTPKPFSVATHSVNCYFLAGVDKHMCREALLHDAHEAYVGDMIQPLKNHFGDEYKVFENRIDLVIRKRFDMADSMPPEVKLIDRFMGTIEQQYVCENSDDWSVFGEPDVKMEWVKRLGYCVWKQNRLTAKHEFTEAAQAVV